METTDNDTGTTKTVEDNECLDNEVDKPQEGTPQTNDPDDDINQNQNNAEDDESELGDVDKPQIDLNDKPALSKENVQKLENEFILQERKDHEVVRTDSTGSSFNSDKEEKAVNELVWKALQNAVEIVRNSEKHSDSDEYRQGPLSDSNQDIVDIGHTAFISDNVEVDPQQEPSKANEYTDGSSSIHEYAEVTANDGLLKDSTVNLQDRAFSHNVDETHLTSSSQGIIPEGTPGDGHSSAVAEGVVNIHVPYGVEQPHPANGINYEDVQTGNNKSLLPGRAAQHLHNSTGSSASTKLQQQGRTSKISRKNQLPKITSASSSYPVDFDPRISHASIRSLTSMPSAMASPRAPVNIIKMSTVMDKTRKRTERQRQASIYFEEKRHPKVLTLDQCINSRPPLPFDLDGPGPLSYDVPIKPLYETNAPRYTFGMKFHERDGGGRTAWAKTWFNSPNNHTMKVNFEKKWPTPATHISSKSLVGRRVAFKPEFPSYSIGVRTKFNKQGSANEPSPNNYNVSKSDSIVFRKAPSFSMTFRHKGTSIWAASDETPSPDWYTPRFRTTSVHHPAFTIQGIRRPKNHMLGPHATL